LRLSFAGLEPAEIRRGVEILGSLIRNARNSGEEAPMPALAMVRLWRKAKGFTKKKNVMHK
jgi:hypothetical protein